MSAPLSEISKPRETGSAWRQLGALARLRCPRCHKGRLFHGWFGMNDPCPVCGLILQREEGYFLGAMYVSYGLSVSFLSSGPHKEPALAVELRAKGPGRRHGSATAPSPR